MDEYIPQLRREVSSLIRKLELYMMASPVDDNTNSSQWALLPDDLLHMITDRLDELSDYVRFGAVCKPWLSFSHRNYKDKHLLHTNQQLPLLVVPTQGYQERRGLYSITKGMVYDQIQLNLPYKRCCGSSHGWLFFVENKSSLELILINPFLGESETMIKLPPIQFISKDEVLKMDEYGVVKAILSKDPYTSPDDYEVMAIYGGYCKLAHYKSGDKFWSYPTTEKLQVFADVIFCKGNIYAVDHYNWIVKITLRRFKKSPGGNCSPCYLQFKTISKKLQSLKFVNYAGRAYLVETSKGDLLLVRRYYMHMHELKALDAAADEFRERMHAAFEARNQEVEHEEFDRSKVEEEVYAKPHLSVKFRVYRLNFPSARRKLRMRTLNGETLFLGDNHSISISASKCPGLSPNSIYYTDDYTDDYGHNIEFGSCDTGVFKVKDKSFGKHFVPSFSAKGMPPPIFVLPHYKCNTKRIV